eukprot:TRINITY_DN25170_c0_g1_i1.p1 TRINITY_DN25170_c0_g1~~TRINITY_DN25170_c0_g1_i1.p1  ORF type:complete len:263 (+),score=59.18 TRINITY_DN25170_c0_g1_i1:175-963(+)
MVDGVVVGNSSRDVRDGDELTHLYCHSFVELIYRYGFIPAESTGPMEEDVVSITLEALLAASECTARDTARCGALLASLGLVDESPWDGLDFLTSELRPGGRGVAGLVAAGLLLSLPEKEWGMMEESAAAQTRLSQDESPEDDESEEDEESEEDDREQDARVLAVVCRLCAVHGVEFSVPAGELLDLWPGLLVQLSTIPTFERAVEVAKRAVAARLEALGPPVDAQGGLDTPAGMAGYIWRLEAEILAQAKDALGQPCANWC